jgi:hypothetical protein
MVARVHEVRQATIRIEMRVSQEMNEFLQVEAHSRKLSFEGLLLTYVEDRMKRSLDEKRHVRST